MTMDDMQADFIIIGGGIAGASAGYALRRRGRVLLLEREPLPGYHTTGRSSAIFQKSYQNGDPLLHQLVRASESFLRRPPADFAAASLLRARPLIYIAPRDRQDVLDRLYRKLSQIDVEVEFRDGRAAVDLMPVLAPDYGERVLYEAGIADIDVNALHGGYLRGIKAAGGRVMTRAEVLGLERRQNQWRVTTTRGAACAPVVVNAAGAWVDRVAEMAGVPPIGIQPLRRTVVIVPLADGVQGGGPVPDQWPVVMNPAEGYYFKPDSGRILITPGDEHLSPPGDVQPEEIDIAYGAHYLEQATTLKVENVAHSWAGLRNHVADRHPVVGFDPAAPGFFWLAGQGGFGIKTAPALARITAALIAGAGLPEDMIALGLRQADISVDRLRRTPVALKA